jgi:hypothetical protein
MSNSIIAVDFDPAMHLGLVSDFACGDEPWEKELVIEKGTFVLVIAKFNREMKCLKDPVPPRSPAVNSP